MKTIKVSLPAQLILTLMGLLWICPGSLQADPLDEWTWRNPLPQGHCLFAVAYGNNQFVAVGDAGTIIQSGIVAPIQPVLGPVTLLSNGAAQMTLRGLPEETYSVQALTNLTQWMVLTNVALANP